MRGWRWGGDVGGERAGEKSVFKDPPGGSRLSPTAKGSSGNATISSFFWKDHLDASALKGAKRTQEEQLGGCARYLTAWARVVTVDTETGVVWKMSQG